MRRIFWLALVLIMINTKAKAQPQSTVYEGEIGLSLGAAHYFGDLNIIVEWTILDYQKYQMRIAKLHQSISMKH